MTEQFDGFEEREPSRYVVGIDLGTTNSAVSYIDTEQVDVGKTGSEILPFGIQQWVDIGQSERRDLLPSFLYQPTPSEAEQLTQPDENEGYIVGVLARNQGLARPGRQIQSSKSWLCHAGVDRRAAILPWQSEEEVPRISPVAASAACLRQIADAWNAAFNKYPLADQDIVLTLPASFDQVARQLTIEAAAAAGLKRILPIEEPQAAFYAWLAKHQESWEQKVAPGQTILVCDIGGGTTDFTLIRVRESNTASPIADGENINESVASQLALHRVAVGQHLILGGDNIDLALAKLAEQRLSGGRALLPREWESLRGASRVAKETLLGEHPPESYTLHIAGSGSKLVAGGKQVALTRDDVDSTILEGFFPKCSIHDRPQQQAVGFQEFGLPFATDAAITKHLAQFLWEHRQDGRTDSELASLSDTQQAKPDWILFNGGVMTSSQLQKRVVDVVGSWFSDEAAYIPGILSGERLDRAVASGAAYFGLVRRGQGVRIEAKLACSFYMQTTTNPPQAVCIVPGTANPGDAFELDKVPMQLNVGMPVQFPILYSSARLADRIGTVVQLSEDAFSSLPPVRTVVQLAGRRQATIPVVLETRLSQIGTLAMQFRSVDTDQRWKLEFDIRGSTQTDHQQGDEAAAASGILDDSVAQAAARVCRQVFTPDGKTKPAKLFRELAAAVELNRSEWPPSLLRSIWAELIELEEGRRQSPAHEARWLNALGYCLRPGYGMAADDWRVAQTWRTVFGKLAFATATTRDEALILWRRIAGGFTAGQQLTVYQQVAGPLRSVLDPAKRGKGGGSATHHELTELLRLVGSLELLPVSEKRLLGGWLVSLVDKKKWLPCQPAVLWTIGRLGSRQPAYGPLNGLLPVGVVESWIEALLRLKGSPSGYAFALMLCSRRVGDRYRDVSADTREQVVDRLRTSDAPMHYVELVAEGGSLDGEDTAELLGETLPLGLQLG